MRGDVLKVGRLRMASTVALMVLAGFAAGCSADVARFDDGFYTGALPKGSVGGTSPAYAASVDQVNTGSVDRRVAMAGAGAAMSQSPGYPSASAQAYPASPSYAGAATTAPVTRTASIERTTLAPPTAAASPVQPQRSASLAPARPSAAAASGSAAGWHDTGNTVTLRAGETVSTLANRYGVPEKAILSVNGLSSAGDAQPGQSIVIPAYSYGQTGVRPQAVAASAAGQALGTPPGPLRAPTAAASAASAPASSRNGGTVVVASGDSINGIARRHGVSAAALRSANDIDGEQIRIGQTLVLPNGAKAAAPATRVASIDRNDAAMTPSRGAAPATLGQTPQPKAYEPPHKAGEAAHKPEAQAPKAPAEAHKAETPAAAAEAPAVKTAQPKAAPAVTKPEPAAPAAAEAPKTSVATEVEQEVATAAPAGTGIDQFRWPVQGRVVKRFGEKVGSRRNDGVNISVPAGTPVKAAENGVVIYAGDGLKEFGNTVLVKHDNGLVTVYGYADAIKVQRGATVKRGQEIATAGMTGDADTPMVHFEVRKNSAPVDPMTYLQ